MKMKTEEEIRKAIKYQLERLNNTEVKLKTLRWFLGNEEDKDE